MILAKEYHLEHFDNLAKQKIFFEVKNVHFLSIVFWSLNIYNRQFSTRRYQTHVFYALLNVYLKVEKILETKYTTKKKKTLKREVITKQINFTIYQTSTLLALLVFTNLF